MKALLTFHTMGGENGSDIIALNSIVIDVEEAQQIDKIVESHENRGICVQVNILEATQEQLNGVSKFMALALLVTGSTDSTLEKTMAEVKKLQYLSNEYIDLIEAKNTDRNLYGESLYQIHRRLGVNNQTEAIQKLNKILCQPPADINELKKQIRIAVETLYEINNGIGDPKSKAMIAIDKIAQSQIEFNIVNRNKA